VLARDDTPAMLIAMPQGLGVNGVVSWALRLAGVMADRGWRVVIAAHREPKGHARVDHALHAGVELADLRHLPPIDTPGISLAPFVEEYRTALESLGWSRQRPAIVLPSLEANCYAAAAALASTHGDRLRVIGWQHSDNPFDASMLQNYEPMFSAVACVSQHITTKLRQRLPWRSADVHRIPYGVELGEPPETREQRPIELIYPGRMEHEARRVGVLCEVARLLHDDGVPHRLTLVGDGPAAAEVDQRLDGLPNARRLDGLPRSELRPKIAAADALLLTSRYEGLNVAMLEAMASGVAPIVTRVESGAAEAIEHGVSGLLIEAGYHEGEHAIARRMTDAIALLATDRNMLDAMRAAAYERAAQRYSLGVHGEACEELFTSTLAAEPRWWPLDRPCTLVSDHAASPSSSVPPDATERAARAIAAIEGPIAIYGAGRHTLALAEVLARANVVCIIDDDPKNHGTTLWGWPVVGLDQVSPGTSVLVSSFIHQDAMEQRLHTRGLEAITLYELADGAGSCSS
jgi:glycosyltransferase involved in cell wall biosynthesis